MHVHVIRTIVRTLQLEDRGVRGDIARVYWQLVFIMVLPQCLTFLRSAAVGVIGKTREAYPWPGRRAMIAVSY